MAIPHILRGENSLLIAPTGTGKTYAAILPIFDLFLSRGERAGGISILYVTPLRALNRDVLRRVVDLGRELGIEVQIRHGDTPARARALQAKSPPDMLITTPETLQAILPGKLMRRHLKGVRWVIVDEIHELAGDKRGVQLSVALERLVKLAGREFQRVGLSATVGDEEKIAKFLVGAGRKVTVVKSPGFKKINVKVEYAIPTGEDAKVGEKLGIPAGAVARVKRVRELILNHNSVLVFTNTREHAEALASQLKALDGSLSVEVHHGSLSREIREDVEARFHSGEIKAVVCTSSLELGIDVGRVDLVVQYMSPRQAVNMIQRVGRSGHSLEAEPKGVVISSWVDDALESAVIAGRAVEGKLEEVKVHENALDVLAHQIVGLTLDFRAIPLEEAYGLVKAAYPYRNLSFDVFLKVVEQLKELGLVRVKGGLIKPSFARAFRYYYENLSVIPDVKRYTVFDFARKRRIGTLDQEFVAKRCSPGVEFIMHGHTWKVVKIDEERLSVEVEPVPPSLEAIPSWEGELIPVEREVAAEVGALREALAKGAEDGNALGLLAKRLRIGEEALRKISETIKMHASNYPLPTHRRIVVERFENVVIVHSCFGSLVNETLGMALLAVLKSKYGINIPLQTDQYRIGLVFPFKPDPNVVAGALKGITPENLIDILNLSLEGSELFWWRHWHVARRFGAIERSAEFKRGKARLLAEAFRSTPINEEAKREVFLEKFDLEGAKRVLEGVRKGEITVEAVEDELLCSPLAYPMVDKIVPHEVLRPAIPERPLVEIVKERILSKLVKLTCIFNGDWSCVKTVKGLPEKIKCPKCGSTLVALSSPDKEVERVVKKRLAKRPLTEEEKKIWDEAWKSASLIQTYRRKAAVVLSGHGVGPAAAARILRKPLRSEEELYNEIIKAEREYARTRMFWD